MKYQIGEQVINLNSGDLEIIESSELISDVMLYYTVSGKSFAETQLSRYWKTVEDAKEIVNKVIDKLTINLTIKNRELFTTESIIKSLEEYKKERLKNERRD
jgi:hypothetical protein